MLTHLEERIRMQDTKVEFKDLQVVRVVGRGKDLRFTVWWMLAGRGSDNEGGEASEDSGAA